LHFDHIKNFFKDRYSIVFLRDPVERFISQYYFYKNDAESVHDEAVLNARKLDLEAYLDLYRKQKLGDVCNRQTWQLSGSFNMGDSSEDLLQLAEENLSAINFIGIQEYFVDSVDLLCLDCNWPYQSEIPSVNVTTAKKNRFDITEKILQIIQELNHLDIELYSYGVKLFNEKKRRILGECIKRNYERASNNKLQGETINKVPGNSYAPIEGNSSRPMPNPSQLAQEGQLTERLVCKEICSRQNEFGSFEIRIMDAYVVAANSGSSIIRTGDPAIIKIFYKSSITTDALTIGFIIEDMFGQTVFGTNSFYLKQKIAVEENKLYCATYEVRMNLGEGTYRLNASLHTKDNHLEHCYHWKENLFEFTVAGHSGVPFVGITKLYPILNEAETHEMIPLDASEISKLHIKIKKIKEIISSGRFVMATILLENNSNTTISSHPPNPVNTSYHWIEAKTGNLVAGESLRSKIEPPLNPGSTGNYIVSVVAPNRKGDYILRLTLVQEDIAWYDGLEQPVYEDILIRVT
jgi:hypothetical protein